MFVPEYSETDSYSKDAETDQTTGVFDVVP